MAITDPNLEMAIERIAQDVIIHDIPQPRDHRYRHPSVRHGFDLIRLATEGVLLQAYTPENRRHQFLPDDLDPQDLHRKISSAVIAAANEDRFR